MRVRETIIRPIGNSAGVTIPKETLERYQLAKGDKVIMRETEEGILVMPYSAPFNEAMAAYHEVAKKYRNALRELSRR